LKLPASDQIIPKNEKGQVLLDNTSIEDTWVEMERLLASGKVKNIGVSNFTRSEIEHLLKSAKHKPDVNQIELHPVSLCSFKKEAFSTVADAVAKVSTTAGVHQVVERAGDPRHAIFAIWELEPNL
jgi:predicted oxidoreductase